MVGPALSGSIPRMDSSPAERGETQEIIRMVELLPAPLGPRNPNASPGWTSKLTPATASNDPNLLTRSRALMSAPGPAGSSSTLLSPMFESLSDRFDAVFTRLRGRGRLSEADVDEAMREIRLALLQADVNLRVVRDFVTRIREELVGLDLSNSLTPSQQVVKVVHEEMQRILGGETLRLTYASRPPTVILLAGLQGSGKTTTAAKLAGFYKRSQGRHPLLVNRKSVV